MPGSSGSWGRAYCDEGDIFDGMEVGRGVVLGKMEAGANECDHRGEIRGRGRRRGARRRGCKSTRRGMSTLMHGVRTRYYDDGVESWVESDENKVKVCTSKRKVGSSAACIAEVKV